MKIGILTLPIHNNYGGILQAYALQTVLERMGHKVEVINNRIKVSHLPLWKKPLSYTKRIIKRYILGDKKSHILQERRNYEYLLISSSETQKFVDKHIHQRIINSFKDINPNDYDAIVVGSDQVWRKVYFRAWNKSKYEDAFLDFTEGWNIIRISYAASFGTSKIEVSKSHLRKFARALNRFKAISVREKSGINICNQFGVKAKWMPNPTLLLSHEDYEQFVDKSISESQKGILMSYILDINPEKEALREKIAKEKSLDIYIPNKADGSRFTNNFQPQEPVENWLGAFANASYVIIDSFHGCVFSILFHKQFTVIANKNRGMERFTSLLEMFGLEDRLIYTPSEYHQLPNIDYDKVDTILEERRKDAYQFLNESLA